MIEIATAHTASARESARGGILDFIGSVFESAIEPAHARPIAHHEIFTKIETAGDLSGVLH